MKLSIIRRLALVTLLLSAASLASAVTSDDYTKAGHQLYSQKDYAQAIRYYDAALSLDPNNLGALQGRANCRYSLGQLQPALADYEKVQSLNPNDQLNQFIQALRAKAGTSTQALPPETASGGSFPQGVALYQQKQYSAAIPYFEKAVQEAPNDGKPNYYLGLSYLALGDTKNAALNLSLSNKKQPNPSVEVYVAQLKSRLTAEDQQWVDAKAAAGGQPAGVSQSAPKNFGIRFHAGILPLNLADFQTHAETNKAAAATLQGTMDPTYSFNAQVPTLSPLITSEPFLRLSPDLELGLPFTLLPAGTITDSMTNSNSVTVTDSYQIDGFTVGLGLRYFFGKGDIQPFLAAGPMLSLVSVTYAASYSSTTLLPTGTAKADGNFSGMGFGVQAQLGVDWHLGDMFTVSPFVGYQMASADNLKATMKSGTNAGQEVLLSVVPTADGSVVTPVSAGTLVMPIVTSAGTLMPGSAAPAGTKTLALDLGGIKGGIQVSVAF